MANALNSVVIIALMAVIVLFDCLVESKTLTGLTAWQILLVYFVMGVVSCLALRGGLVRRLLYLVIGTLLAFMLIELILGSDPAYPFVRFLFMLPVGGTLLLGAVGGFAIERVLKRGAAASPP